MVRMSSSSPLKSLVKRVGGGFSGSFSTRFWYRFRESSANCMFLRTTSVVSRKHGIGMYSPILAIKGNVVLLAPVLI